VWFRFYTEALDDPKVQKLPAEHFRVWVNLLCVAKKHDGKLPSESDCAFMLRMDTAAFHVTFEALKSSGLIDEKVGQSRHTEPHNWSKRQYKSDTSAERTRRYRNRHRDVTETPPETETETETETEVEVEETNTIVLSKKRPELSQFLKAATKKGASNGSRPGARCPANLEITERDREYARKQGVSGDELWPGYIAHFTSGQGRNKTASDWRGGNSAWGTWCRNQAKWTADRISNRPQSGGAVAAARALMD